MYIFLCYPRYSFTHLRLCRFFNKYNFSQFSITRHRILSLLLMKSSLNFQISEKVCYKSVVSHFICVIWSFSWGLFILNYPRLLVWDLWDNKLVNSEDFWTRAHLVLFDFGCFELQLRYIWIFRLNYPRLLNLRDVI